MFRVEYEYGRLPLHMEIIFGSAMTVWIHVGLL